MSKQTKINDKDYRAWIQRQPSCISGRFSEWIGGEGRNVAAHVRRAGSSGTGYKGEFCCVPLTQDEHLVQHNYGEESLRPKAWWDEQVQRYLTLWEMTL